MQITQTFILPLQKFCCYKETKKKCITRARNLTSDEYVEMFREDERIKEEAEELKEKRKIEREKRKMEIEEKRREQRVEEEEKGRREETAGEKQVQATGQCPSQD